jgi:riboflavin synthase
MFTGIIQEIGRVKSAVVGGGNMTLEIDAPKIAVKLDIGASVAINGACQTVIGLDREYFQVEAVRETLTRTNLETLRIGSFVNLELPLAANDLLHGHLVQGHIDCLSVISEIRPIAGSTLVTFEYPRQYEKYVIEKGSIAVDGVSLTVVQTSAGSFTVSVIPHTIKSTTFRFKKTGDKVNLEFDMIAKYVERMVSPRDSKINYGFLEEHGF